MSTNLHSEKLLKNQLFEKNYPTVEKVYLRKQQKAQGHL